MGKRSKRDVRNGDPRTLARSSRLRLAGLETRGVPSILLGVAAIVLAAGVSSALRKSATLLPESLREAREFWVALREPRRGLAGS